MDVETAKGYTPGLINLPTELVQNITQRYLILPNVLALQLTCKRFYSFFPIRLLNLASQCEKRQFFHLLARVSPFRNLIACPDCLCFRSPDKFVERSKPFEGRQCLHHSKIWLCAHKHADRDELQEARSHGVAMVGCHSCSNRMLSKCYATMMENKFRHIISLELVQSEAMRPNMATNVPRAQFALDRVAAVLRSLPIPVCRHLKLSDPFVLQRYTIKRSNIQRASVSESVHPGGKWLRWPSRLYCRKGLLRSVCSCPEASCQTTTSFEVHTKAKALDGQKHLILTLSIDRCLGTLQDVLDPAWVNHVMVDEEHAPINSVWNTLIQKEDWPLNSSDVEAPAGDLSHRIGPR